MKRTPAAAPLVFLAIALLLAPRWAGAAEHLAQPCRAFNVLSGRVVTDPAGREWLVMANMNETSGLELIFIDPATNTGTTYRAPAGAGSWAVLPVPGDRLAVGTYYDGTILLFDLKTMSFVASPKVPGESYVWELALGSDGRVYGGTYPRAKLGALDLATNAVESFATPEAAKSNLYLRNVTPTPDGRLLCRFGMGKPVTLLFDPKTKAFTEPPALLREASRGVVWGGKYLILGDRVFAGPELSPVDPPPFPVPAGRGWSVETRATTSDWLVLRQGNTVYRYRAGDAALTKLAPAELRGTNLLGCTKAGDVVGVRGGEYIVLRAGSDATVAAKSEVAFRPIPVTPGPRTTHFLRFDARRGRLWGGPTFGQTVFWLDPSTKTFENTAKVCDGGGEVYDAAFAGDSIYLVAYSGGDIIAYNPDKPWDRTARRAAANPRTIASLDDQGDGYIRPVAGVSVGPDGKLYSGWMSRYGTYGGAVAITDPATGDTELLENPLGVRQAVSGLAVGANGLLYLGTSLAGNGLPAKTGEDARFAVYDRVNRRVIVEKTFPGKRGVSSVVLGGSDTGRIAFLVDRELHVFDTASNTIIPPQESPVAVTSHGLAVRETSEVLYAKGASAYALDLRTGRSVHLGDAPARIEHLTAGKGDDVYVASGPDVYRLTRPR